jgi:hypothetical protein
MTDVPLHPVSEQLVSAGDLATLRIGAPPTDPIPLLDVINNTDALRIASVDGLVVAWLSPRARIGVRGLLRGKYTLSWRSPLGESPEAPSVVAVPGSSTPTADAAAP